MTAILDGDVRPQSKRDDFKRQYKSTINRINGYYCCQLAMKLTVIPADKMTNEEKQKLDKLNDKAKTLESSSRMSVSADFKYLLDTALICAYSAGIQSGGYASQR